MTKSTKRKGISVERMFSVEGIHPYDELDWELRDVEQKNWKTGEVVFEQKGVEFPTNWSINASTIVTTKYFRGNLNTPQREFSLKQVIDRVAETYSEAGFRFRYFSTKKDAKVFEDELKWLLVNQYFAFNSPVWFNVGTKSPQQVSACFILGVDDSMESILNWYQEEGMIFKGGSGAGVNLSNIRSSKELLSSGGAASGPVSFMRGADSSAGAIKSGGTCLAPWTQVYTAESGPVEVSELAKSGEKFTTVSYNPILGRMQATRARAWESGFKKLVKLKTDKGEFTLSYDHPVMLMSGGYMPVGELQEGMSIRPGNITINSLGYSRVGLQDGKKSKESIHRLIAKDVLGWNVEGKEVHHKDKNPNNNSPDNLELISVSDHKRLHALEDIEEGIHPFLGFHGKGNHPQVAGEKNGMSFASGNRTEEFRRSQIAGMHREDVYRVGQKAAATQRMLNKAYEVINSGGSIDTFEDYFKGRKKLAGKMGYSKSSQLEKIESRFGSYDSFKEEVRTNNHRVVSVSEMYDSVVYDVEVESDTPEDRSNRDGHNFMIISETNAQKGFTGIMVHNTRRAAKMVVLDVDHPDIEEFVQTKAKEERKIRVLRDAGFNMDLDGDDISSVQFQNANNSVRVDDEFMQAVLAGDKYDLKSRTTGEALESLSARKLFRDVAQAAWECADPGIQYKSTINKWHTNKTTGPITASNPCSEYLSIDNSSCNLASLNLMKFLKEDGSFDIEVFVRAVEIVFTAMDISISFADFPTEKIGKNTRDFRQLGIGYANLGALLMATGKGYDTPEGLSTAAAITSLMTSVAYRRSAELAGVVGPYKGYAENAQDHNQVIEMHKEANDGSAFTTLRDDEDIHLMATKEWEAAVSLGKENGYRNAQASLLAPTGTIGFMMDCDTTGIEPDFSLVKFKKLVGGGSMQIVNQTVPLALQRLGYSDAEVEAIVNFIAENGHVVGAPALKEDHYPVFDTAMGERAIEPMGHVRMMAAVQPFLSGAISKTVNMPESATVEDIEQIYMSGWQMGLKALAVYRDNCKVGQPLSSGKSQKKDEKTVETVIVNEPSRVRMPRTRNGKTTSFSIGGSEGYVTSNSYEDGRIGEIFVKLGKQGSTLSGVMDAFSIAVSIGLQYGVPLDTFVRKLTNMKFEPSGMTDDPDIRISQSLMDYIFRRIALDFLSFEERSELGILSASERVDQVEAEEQAPRSPQSAPEATEEVKPSNTSDLMEKISGIAVDAPLCFTCGTKMRPSGSCYVCEDCGSTSGCS